MNKNYSPGDHILVPTLADVSVNNRMYIHRSSRKSNWTIRAVEVIKAYPHFVLTTYKRGAFQIKEGFLYCEIIDQ